MKLKTMLLLVLGLFVFAGMAQAQTYTAAWYWYNDTGSRLPLTDGCVAGTPFPDGTPMLFVWDNDANGADDDDPLPTICANPPECASGPAGTVNMNQFGINGQATGDGAGFFEMDTYFQANGPFTNPRFFLRVCGSGMRWQSNVFTLTSGLPQEFQPSQIVWTCMNTPCPGCSSPTAPSLITASTNRCDGIMVNWTAVTDTSNDGYILSRDGNWLATITNPATQQYLDNGVSVGDHSYSVLVRHICNATDSTSSSLVTAPGHRVLNPPTPTAGTVTATDATCNSVTVQWSFTTTAGLDWWVITRNGDSVGTVSNAGSPGQRTFVHTTPLSGQANYCVYGASAGCGWGVPGCDNGTALQPAPVPTQVVASDGVCNVINITWHDSTGESGYQVYRQDSGGGNEISIGNVGQNITTFPYTLGACGTVYRFVVRSTSTCGNSAPSVFDNGSMLCSPTSPTGFTATDSTLCTGVHLTWSDVLNETYYKILRSLTNPPALTDSIGNAAANATSYDDNTGTAGTVYWYAVAAANTCGGVASAANQGARKAVPPQVTGVSASDANCGAVIVTWNNVTSEDSFQVRRNGTRIGKTVNDVLQFNDSTGTPGTTYAYTVVPYDLCGAGTESAPDNGTRPPGLPAPVMSPASTNNCATVLLSWSNIAGEDSFQVRRDGGRIGKTLPDVLTYNDSTAVPGTTYAYTVVGYNACGVGTVSNSVNGSRLPAMPAVAGVSATDANCANVVITWTDPTGEDSVQIRRDGVRIGRTTGNIATFTDDNATPGQTYTYRAVAYNTCGAGDTTGTDQGMRGATPGQVLNVLATDNRCDSVVVTWDVVPGATTYHIFRNAGEVGTSATNRFAHQPSVGAADYTVSAENTCGPGTVSASDVGTRLTSPTAPTTVAASDTSCLGVNVVWSGSTGDVDSFRVYRGATLIATKGPGESSHFDTDASNGVNSYTVVSVSTECGPSAASNAANGTRLVPPGIPTNVAATTTDCDTITVTWTTSTGDVDLYIIERDGFQIAFPGPGATFYYDTGVSSGNHFYTVEAGSNHCGSSGLSPEVTGSLALPPTAASNVQATSTFCDRIDVTWTAGTGSISGYTINRDGGDIGNVGAGVTTFSDNTASVGTHDYYVVTFSTACGNAEASNTDQGERVAFPTAPANVAASDTSCAVVYVVWDAIAEPHDYYVIYADGDSIGNTTNTTFNYAPAPGSSHDYTIAARSLVCGLGPQSVADNGQRLPGAGVPANLAASDNDCDAILLTWNTAEGFIEDYRIYRDGDFLIAQSAPDTTYSDVVPAGVVHTYEVSAFNSGCGETVRSNSDPGMRRPLLSQVLGVTASTDNCAGILVSWTGQAGASKYYIYRTATLIDSVTDPTTNYLDTGVANGETASYTVAATNVCGPGTQSDPANGTRHLFPLNVTTVNAASDSCGKITVTWVDVTGELGYIIVRDNSAIDSVGPDVLTFNDYVSGTHIYHVQSYNVCGASALADTASATAPSGVQPPTNVAATDINCPDVVITWTASANALFYTITRDGNVIANNITLLTYTDTPTPGTYVYGVQANNECGQGAAVTDNGTRLGPPALVQGLTASQDSCHAIYLSWTDLPDEDHYTVLRDGAVHAVLPANTVAYVDTPLTPTTNDYQVFADNECGNGDTTVVVVGRVPSPPGQVTGLTASTNLCATVHVTWTDLADETQYSIWRDGDSIAVVGANVVAYDDSPTLGTHAYRVRGLNACGTGQMSDPINGALRDGPGTVPLVTASDNQCFGVTVTWTNVANEDSFRIYRSDNPNVRLAAVLADVTTYVDATGIPGTTYTYCVAAWNACAESGQACDQGTALGFAPQVTTVTATDNSSVNVVITWNDVAGESGYHLTRDGNPLTDVGPDIVTYTDVPPSGTYTYCVTSVNQCGNTPTPVCDSGTRIAAPLAVNTVSATDDHCNDIVVTWTAVANADSYLVVQVPDTVQRVLGTTTSVTLTPAPGTYQYRVFAKNGAGLGPQGNTDSGTRLAIPGAVTGVSATDTRCDNVVISWTAVAGAVNYTVTRNGGNPQTVTGTTATDTPPPGTYTYAVVANNTCGTGPQGTDSGTRRNAPLPPTNVVATGACGHVTVTWANGGGDFEQFLIKRNGTTVGTVANNVFTYQDNVAAGTYNYTVAAHTTAGDPGSCPDAESTPAVPGTSHALPGVPTNLAAAAPNCTSVNLTWTASTGEVTGYTVHRDGPAIALVTTNSYNDASLTDNQVHAYTVAAYNSFCDTTAFVSPTVPGRMRELLIEPTIPGTVLCRDTIDVNLDHCAGVTSDSVAISLNGAAYLPLIVFSPVQPVAHIIIPDVLQTIPNNRLRVISSLGTRRDTVITDPFTIECLAADDPVSGIPTDYVLEQNYPNPFNPSTTIKFGLPVTADVTVEIFDVQGRLAGTLVDGQTLEPGWHSLVWDCSQCPSGMYLVRLQAGEHTMLRKMLLMK